MRALRPLMLVALALAVAPPSPALAQINLAWNNCITEANAAANIAYACDGSRNGLPFKLVCSFVSPASMPAFVGLEATIDIGPPPGPPFPPLPDYWRFDTGECRDGNLLFPTSMIGIGTGATGACVNPWLGGATGAGFDYQSAVLAPYLGRLRLVMARDSEAALQQGQHYLGLVVGLDTFGDVPVPGVNQCDGCCTPMFLHLNQIGIYQTLGSPPQDTYFLITPDQRQYVTWQDGGCPTPSRRTTWGAIKTTYR